MSAGGDIDTVLDILQHVNVGSLKLTDQQVALSIGAIGGVPTRDRRGNVLDTLWVKYSEHSVVGMLLETNDIRKILLEQIQDQLKARRDLIQEVEQNEVVCKWLMAFTKSWETEYSNSIVTRFDIGQLILSAMDEAYFEVLTLFSHAPLLHRRFGENGTQRWFVKCVDNAVKEFRSSRRTAQDASDAASAMLKTLDENKKSEIRTALHTNDYADRVAVATLRAKEASVEHDGIVNKFRDILSVDVHNGDDAVVRVLFRHPNTRSVMCRVAGTILRKQEVCNRAGGYSAKVQRNDISQQKNAALDTFCAWILHDREGLMELVSIFEDPHQLIPHIIDHKGAQSVSDRPHYDHAPAGLRS